MEKPVIDTETEAMRAYARRLEQPDQVVLVCGGRNFRDRSLMDMVLDGTEIDCIVHGGAEGADQMAGDWAISRSKPEIIVPAQWVNFQKNAGPHRNGWMLRFTKVNHVIAFPGGRGTLNMIKQAEKAKIKLTVIER